MPDLLDRIRQEIGTRQAEPHVRRRLEARATTLKSHLITFVEHSYDVCSGRQIQAAGSSATMRSPPHDRLRCPGLPMPFPRGPSSRRFNCGLSDFVG